MTKTDAPAPNEVYLEEHGIPGTLGKPAGQIEIPRDPELLQHIFWITDPTRTVDLHVGFRARFHVAEAGTYRLAAQSSSVFRIWVDGDVVVHGPFRYSPSVLEYHVNDLQLPAGDHVICVEAHDEGVMHRTTAPVPAFVLAALSDQNGPIDLTWEARELGHYGQTGLRVSPLLGWMETHAEPQPGGWHGLPESDPGWRPTMPARDAVDVLGTPSPGAMTLPVWPLVPMRETARGTYSDTFAGYNLDDPASQFLLVDDKPTPTAPIDGQWFRYDLDCVRIGSVELELELERPGTVIIGYAERLTPDRRPSPVVAMSAGPTRMIQQYAVSAGTRHIVPLQSLGGRYIEVRIETDGAVSIRGAGFRERDYLGEPSGSFDSEDQMLNQIWATGVRTLRSSTEDAVVDSVRERGEWLGDVASVAHLIMQSGWSDTAPIRRALLHAAAGAREDGLVAGCGPGELIYLGTYAAQWFETCLLVAATEGSNRVLWEFLEPARANIIAIIASVRDDGTTTLPWGFVDWGYSAPREGVDVAVLAHVTMAVRSWLRWLTQLGLDDELLEWGRRYEKLAALLRPAIGASLSPYHAYTLGYHAGVVTAEQAIPHILHRFEIGFPFNSSGARLKNPTKADHTAVTPYFTNYSMPVLLEAGLGEHVQQLWRDGWGWMLSEGATTWWEVFDDRWSRCHAWSGAPTWQLSHYTLGLRATDPGRPYIVTVNALGLSRASGRIPLRGDNVAHVSWERVGAEMSYTIRSEEPIDVTICDQEFRVSSEPQAFALHLVTGDLFQ